MKPGEKRILKVLKDGPLRDKDIRKKAKLVNSTHRFEYLKKLRKSGLITRNIDSRKYSLVTRGQYMLSLWDILQFVQERFNRVSSQVIESRASSEEYEDLDGAGIGLWQSQFFISKDADMTKIIKKFLFSKEGLKARLAMGTVANLTDSIWRKHSLEVIGANEREMVQAYMDSLRNAVWLLHGPSGDEWRRTRDRLRIEVEKEFRAHYPDINTIEEFFDMETEKRLQVNKERRMNMPADVGELKILKEALCSKGEISQTVATKLDLLFDFLDDPENFGIYDKYIEKLRACPKTVWLSPSTGFRGYLEKYWEMFPDKREEYRAAHPWLYNRIISKQ